MNSSLPTCAVCGGTEYSHREILWPELIAAWQLAPAEVDYINRQQGTICTGCEVNFRSSALAQAILRHFNWPGTFLDFLESETAKTISVVEFNTAGRLSQYMERLPRRRLLCFPEYDMMDIDALEQVDLIVHEDTLEHIPQPVRALSECRGLLKSGGALCFTVPTIVGRMTRSREGLEASYHCTRGTTDEAMRVWWEFGADVWTLPLQAGFRSCAVEAFEYPAALAITCLP